MNDDVFVPATSEPADHAAKLLVCDDSPIERMALCEFLHQLGHHTDEVSDGQSAIAHIKLRHVDLVLMDLKMAGGDGFLVLIYIQEYPTALQVVVP